MENNKTNFLAYRSFHTPLNTIVKFSSQGYDTAVVFPAHSLNSLGTPYSQYSPTWLWYDKIDFSSFDKMIDDTTRAMPNAKLLCMIDLNSPAWLEHNKPYSSADTFKNLGKAIHASDWVEPTMWYLENFVKYANEHYGDRIVGYILVCGNTDEWFDNSIGSESRERRAAWRKYQLAKGRPDPIDIPPESVREHMAHDDFLRDPDSDKLAIEYWHFCNDSIADTILKCAGITRSIVGNKADIGCFYGYIMELFDHRLVSAGHLEYERVIASPDIDFFISPGTYQDRQIGGGSGFMAPHGTVALHGKRLLHECDQRTHTFNPYIIPNIKFDFPHWPDEASTVSGIKREASLAFINRTHLWWFDMWGDFYQGEAVMKTLGKVRDLWSDISSTPAKDACEVALIVDPESTYLVNQDNPMVPEMNIGTRNKLNRLGAPFEVYSFNDIPHIPNFDRYKLVIFTSMFEVTAEKREILDKYVLCDSRFVLWMYAPGIYMNGKFSTSNCEKLSGTPYGTSGLSICKMDGHTSCYVHKYSDLTVSMLKELAERSGVLMNVKEELPVYAEGDLLAVHTKDGGRITISTDEKYIAAEELFTGKAITVSGGKFEYDFSAPDTALFRLS